MTHGQLLHRSRQHDQLIWELSICRLHTLYFTPPPVEFYASETPYFWYTLWVWVGVENLSVEYELDEEFAGREKEYGLYTTMSSGSGVDLKPTCL